LFATISEHQSESRVSFGRLQVGVVPVLLLLCPTWAHHPSFVVGGIGTGWREREGER
jgi:hypothetical protein